VDSVFSPRSGFVQQNVTAEAETARLPLNFTFGQTGHVSGGDATVMKAQIFKTWDRVHSSFWFLPTVMAGGAVASAFVTVAFSP
jgi:hypothetical protein